VRQILQEQGAAFDQRELRSLERRPVEELDREVYRDLLWDLGTAVIESWGTGPLADMSEDQRALLQSYLGRRIMGRIERRVLLHTISRLWIDYLTDIEDLRRGIGLEAYGQRDPLIEYKRQAFELFEELRDNIRRIVARSLLQQMPEPLGAP
jgi:preprotein translocase subunit SecA